MKNDAGTLAIAMTTAPRRAPTLHRALSSLRQAGFNERVHMFAEPGTWDQVSRPKDARTTTIDHATPRGCFVNWRHALQHLLTRTTASWLLIVQDDAIWGPGAAHTLRATAAARQKLRTGFLSPYVATNMVPPGSVDGWNECRLGWDYCGALALCIPRSAAKDLMQHRRFVKHLAKHRMNQQVDAVVGASMLELGRPSYVHVPSLVDHIGMTSTLGHDDVATWVRGYRFGEKL